MLATGDQRRPWELAQVDVACGQCTACCESSQFVHVGFDEEDALAYIPEQLLLPAPGVPRGQVLMGYDNYGRCPMLLGSKCSIYAHRPRTCRVYDCRVFAPSGEEIEDIGKDLIANQVRQWEFRFLGGGHSARRGSKSGCEYLAKEQEELAEEFEEIGSARRSLLAIELRQLF